MKRFVLIHSYSDFNKGDAGIVISTVQQLRTEYKGCRVDMISTFSKNDPIFEQQHKEISKYADNMYTALFPELYLNFLGKRRTSTLAKLFSMVLLSAKSISNYYSLKFFGSLLFGNDDDKKVIDAVKNADVVISKGGSFLCSLGSLREDFSLWRMLYPFYIAKVFNKKTIILAQSLGPFDTSLSKNIFNKSLWAIDEIYFREYRSMKLLEKNGVFIPSHKVKFCPDTAFALDAEKGKLIVNASDNDFSVGVTIVDFPFESEALRENYTNSVNASIDYFVTELKANVYIFPQVINVSQFGDEDLKLAKVIYGDLEPEIKSSVELLEGNYESIDLAKTYGEMDFFLATRLHSSIFSVMQNVPIVNISYHGTKSEGTFELFDYNDFVVRITEVTPESLLDKIKCVVNTLPEKREHLSSAHGRIKKDISIAFNNIV